MDLVEAVRQRKDYQQLVLSLEMRACKLTSRPYLQAGLRAYPCEAHGKICYPWGAKPTRGRQHGVTPIAPASLPNGNGESLPGSDNLLASALPLPVPPVPVPNGKAELDMPPSYQLPSLSSLSPSAASTVSLIIQMLAGPRGAFKDCDKQVAKYAQAHPLWESFGKPIRGFGPVNFALIMGEIGDREFATPAKLWTYFGLGRCMGENQHRTRDVEKAKLLRYPVPRRTLMFNVANPLIFLNKGEYRELYDYQKQRKIEQGWTRGHAHMHAHRLVAKRLLLNLWRELSRGLRPAVTRLTPASETHAAYPTELGQTTHVTLH